MLVTGYVTFISKWLTHIRSIIVTTGRTDSSHAESAFLHIVQTIADSLNRAEYFFASSEDRAIAIQDVGHAVNFLGEKYSSVTNVVTEGRTQLGALAGRVDAQLSMDHGLSIKRLKSKLTKLLCPHLVLPRSAPSIQPRN